MSVEGDEGANASTDEWMKRLLVAMDESLKLGFSVDDLSDVVTTHLSPGDQHRFEEAKHCVQLLDLMLRPHHRSLQGIGSRDATLPVSNVASPEMFPGTARYEVLRNIGAGGMGVVYEALDRERNIRIALKVLNQVGAAQILRFKQEFRRLSNVAHENVVSLFELVQEQDDWFITMELVDGIDFLQATSIRNICKDIAASGGHAPQALRILNSLFQQLAEGLNTLHSAGILHRDLKPHNVLVTADDRVVLIDFGLATSFDWRQLNEIPSSEFAGTCAYMAPEQAACQSLAPACDFYSLGVMLYESLTGQLPFTGPLMMVEKQCKAPPTLSDILPAIPEGWTALCKDLLSQEPHRRPLADQVLRRLREIRDAAEGTSSSSELAMPPWAQRLEESTAFVGRVHELEQLQMAFGQAMASCPVVVSLQGPSGIGKTTLVECFLNKLAQDPSCVILQGRCHEQESLPFKSLDSLVDSLCKYLNKLPLDEVEPLLPADAHLLPRVFPVLMTVLPIRNACRGKADESDSINDAVLLRRRAFDALRELFLSIAQLVPLVLFVDDMQWGDSAGAAVLAEMLDLEISAKLLLIVAFRQEGAAENSCLKSLRLDRIESLNKPDTSLPQSNFRRFAKLEIALRPMSQQEASRLAESLFSVDATGELDLEAVGEVRPRADQQVEIAAESGGHPYFVQELVSHTNSARKNFRQANFKPQTVSLNEVLRQRIQSLPEAARRLVITVAVAGHPVPLNLVCRATASEKLDSRLLHQLRNARLLRFEGGGWTDRVTTFHDRIRENAVACLTSDDRCEIHGRLASAFESTESANPETVAYHFNAAEQYDRARHYYKLAAQFAQGVFAFERAVELYRRALELTTPTDVDACRLRQTFGEACGQAGRGGEAAAAYLAAAEIAPPSQSLELQLAAARQYCISGFTDEGRLLLRKVLMAKGIYLPNRPASVMASLILQRVRLWWENYKFRARSESELSSSVLQRIDLLWDAVSGLSFQEPVAVASLHTQGLREALKAGEPRRLVRALALEAILTATAGPSTKARVDELLSKASDIYASSEQKDSEGMLCMAKGATAFLQVRMPDSIEPLIDAELRFSSKIPKSWWELTTSRSLLTWAYMHMGDFQSLRRCVDAYEQDAEERGDLFLLSSISSAGRPQLLLADHRPDLAQNRIDEIIARAPYEKFQQQHVSLLYSQSQIDLYQGDASLAWNRLRNNWQGFRQSMQQRNQFARVTLLDLRARCAVAAFRQSGDPSMLNHAIRDAKKIKSEYGNWVQPYADRLAACIGEARGEPSISLLASASEGFDRLGFRVCAAVLNLRRGQLLGKSKGNDVIDSAARVLLSQGVKSVQDFQKVFY